MANFKVHRGMEVLYSGREIKATVIHPSLNSVFIKYFENGKLTHKYVSYSSLKEIKYDEGLNKK
jgi:hypothetical protein